MIAVSCLGFQGHAGHGDAVNHNGKQRLLAISDGAKAHTGCRNAVKQNAKSYVLSLFLMVWRVMLGIDMLQNTLENYVLCSVL